MVKEKNIIHKENKDLKVIILTEKKMVKEKNIMKMVNQNLKENI